MTLTADTRGLYSVNVADLTQGANVRADLRLTPEFVKSVRMNGVIQPPIVYPDPDEAGRWRILAGHRRVAAAAKADINVIEVVIRDAPDDADLVVDQLVENVHRDALTDGEQAAAYRQLALDFGLPVLAISRRTATGRDRIGDAIKVASSPVAAKAITEHQLTIDDALVFDEFAEDAPALEELTETLTENPTQLQHQAQRIRNERTDQAERARVEQEIRDAGIRLLEKSEYDYSDPKGYKRAEGLCVGLKYYRSTEQLTAETAIAEAGDDLGARPLQEWEWDAEAERRVSVWRIAYYVRNHRDHGWSHHSDGNRAEKAPLTDDEKAARRLARENGKIWLAATEVRTAWVKQLLERRTLPADWHLIPALTWADKTDHNYGARARAAKMLGLAEPDHQNNTLLTEITGNPAHAPHFLLALAITDLEARWDEKQGWQAYTTVHPHYLRLLASWGYTLSDLEESITTTALAEEPADA